MLKTPKVLYITRKYPPMVGGMENFSYNLYSNFSQNIDIDLIALRKSQKNLVWFIPYALFKVLFSASKYDIIFVGDALLAIIGFFVKIFYKNKQVIVNVFGLDITYKNRLYQFYLKLFYKKFDKYISISQETDKTLHKKGNFDSIVITPGVNVNMFSQSDKDWFDICRQYNIRQDDVILITVGRLVKRKGVEWFIKNVLPNFASKPIKYLIVGTGEEEEKIKKTILECKLEKQVEMLGKVSDEVLFSIYKNTDIFIMPNIVIDGDVEGFGIVALEASLAGCVTVASNIQGIKDAIIDGKNGILLEAENSQQFIDTISKLINSSESCKQLSDKFKNYTIANYSWNNICGQYIKVFDSLVNNIED